MEINFHDFFLSSFQLLNWKTFSMGKSRYRRRQTGNKLPPI